MENCPPLEMVFRQGLTLCDDQVDSFLNITKLKKEALRVNSRGRTGRDIVVSVPQTGSVLEPGCSSKSLISRLVLSSG
jgi:hypothetical protein